jgi:hypothetical protein
MFLLSCFDVLHRVIILYRDSVQGKQLSLMWNCTVGGFLKFSSFCFACCFWRLCFLEGGGYNWAPAMRSIRLAQQYIPCIFPRLPVSNRILFLLMIERSLISLRKCTTLHIILWGVLKYCNMYYRCIAWRSMRCLLTVGKHVLAETISSLSQGNRHDNRKIVGDGVFCWVRPEVI